MEALAGYGSDSSSGDSSEPAAGASGSGGGGGGGALADLLPSDASSSEDERVVPEKAPPVPTTSAASATPGGSTAREPAATSTGDTEGSGTSPTKKRRRWDSGGDDKSNDTTVTTCPLPPPKLSAGDNNGGGGEQVSNAFEELIQFDKDYTAQLRANLIAAAAAQAGGGNDKTNAKVSQQLDALHKTFYGTGANAYATASVTTDDESGRPTSFASHLRHQHEFGNPNLFPNVVEQFGIVAGGSNLPNELWKASCEFRDFESCDRLMAAEEQARFRAANSSNPSG